MRWKGRRQSTNIDDRRTGGGSMRRRGTRRAGGGIGIIIIALIGWFVFGINPMSIIGGDLGGIMGGGTQQTSAPQSGGQIQNDETTQFVRVVLADTEDAWQKIFAQQGARYELPKLVLFRNRVQSACGFASSASGPFYCPGDKQIYIDLTFFAELQRRFEAPGDFAQAYVIAHEVGHHVQNLIGVLPKFNQMRRSLSKFEANRMSIRVELQADCFAGIWARNQAEQGYLERGDVEEALNAATQIGDDAIQRRTQGYVVPESFNHGTSDQRKRWFYRGMEQGSLQACDTFNARSL